jgi:AcrR family transcriptional regulator
MSAQFKESDKTKKSILHAAKTEFAAKGFSGARMGSIASIAGVNQALIHYHFGSKEDLYKAVIEKLVVDISGIYDKKIISEVDSWNVPPDLKLCAAIYVFVNAGLYIHDDDFNRIMAYEIAEGKGVIHEFIREYLIPQLHSVDEIIKDGVSTGIFDISNTMLLSINILTFIRHLAQGVDFFKGTGVCDEIYSNRSEILFNFMLQYIFKALRPEGKELLIPDLDQEKKNKLDSILKEMRDDIKNF